MAGPGGRRVGIGRRSFLQLAAVTGGFGAIAACSSPSEESDDPGAAERDVVVLGDFETDLDGWSAPDETALERVTEEDIPVGVVSGDHGLAVRVGGDARPAITNERRARVADFPNNPHLGLHVVATPLGTNSSVDFRFRLHHAAPEATRSTDGDASRDDETVVESAPKTVPQLRPNRLEWDLSEYPVEVLETATRLEIVWDVAEGDVDRPSAPAEGPDYRWLVTFDDVRLHESPPLNEVRRLQQKRMNLHRQHGMIVERDIEESREGYERGTLEYADGTEVQYSFEVVGEDQFRHTLDNETFRTGDGWE